eukprot:912555_1
MKLTPQHILSRARVGSLEHVTNVNLWGLCLDDISLVRELPNLRVISLSVNSIKTLEDFAACPRLEELYLRANQIEYLDELTSLKNLRHLRVLWLEGNPCATYPDYRLRVLRELPILVKLDDKDVTREELRRAKNLEVSSDSFEVRTVKPAKPKEIIEDVPDQAGERRRDNRGRRDDLKKLAKKTLIWR